MASVDDLIMNWSKGPKTPTTKKAPPPAEPARDTSELAAAQALRKALLELESAGKEYPKQTHWIPLVRKALGRSRLRRSLFDKVVAAGIQAKLFKKDGEYLFIPPETKEPAKKPPSKRTESPGIRIPEKPKAPSPHRIMDCGHPNFQRVPKEGTEDEEYLCNQVRPRNVRRFNGPEDCYMCSAGLPGKPQYQKGEYRSPVPLGNRRTASKDSHTGFPGLCADPETGFYIGGVGNNCRLYHDGPERCVAHAPRETKTGKDT